MKKLLGLFCFISILQVQAQEPTIEETFEYIVNKIDNLGQLHEGDTQSIPEFNVKNLTFTHVLSFKPSGSPRITQTTYVDLNRLRSVYNPENDIWDYEIELQFKNQMKQTLSDTYGADHEETDELRIYFDTVENRKSVQKAFNHLISLLSNDSKNSFFED